MTTGNLIFDIERFEGLRLSPYKDSRGIWTIGYGHNMQTEDPDYHQWTIGQAVLQLGEDIKTAEHGLDHFLPWWTELDNVRQDALVNLTFNIGIYSVLGFHHFLGFLQSGAYSAAGDALVDSDWAREVGDARADFLKAMIVKGARPA
jgi:lysozyme